ncbi:tetratricopeptide repeat-containing diguanylate cyclase [Kineococcus rhizosphaerae]|uniref:Diguanylate cyclase (GGDEF)-like protein n=1 Tax=Kineococcus rhizosphaerae TaxID=559628 RepID=A0A2T0R316_9ACTN|nr:GGDEF domain-containing protein [Kineococcus rhizosphaerae]PRY14184.1 diguanylate cyclase (GGDEF)-like protein [Kineococcus rhizosphaerae]
MRLAPGVTHLVDQVRALERSRGYELLRQEPAAVALERAAEAAGDRVAGARASLVRADIACSAGDIDTASTLVQAAVRVAEEFGDDELSARTHYVRSLMHLQAGDVAESRWHAVRSVELLPPQAPAWLRAEHLLGLTVVLDRSIDSHDAVIAEILAIAATEDDHELELYALNNTAWEHADLGRVEEAVRLAARLRRVAAQNGIRLRCADLDTVAVVEMRAGRLEEAWETISQAFAPGTPVIGADHEAIARLTAFRILIGLGRPAEALGQLELARRIGTDRRLPGLLADVEEADATYRATTGDWEGAYRAHVRFHEEHARLQARQNAARALLAQAQFDASTARRDRDRFRTLAFTDSLTGLPNRRAVEDHVHDVLDGPGPVAVAIVDLDHFKRVNDERSHDAGDAVLRELGGLLTEYVSEAPGKFVARLGGEEFVVVWEGWTSTAVSLSAEALRALVARHDWNPCTTGLPVTVSIGFAATDESRAATWSDLMARADARLYEAKRGGRDRVVGPAESPDPGDVGAGR